MPRKVNYLKDMKIKEISLVTEPASPGAQVLFTKARDVSEEPRDERGRWTTGVVGQVRAHVARASKFAQEMAQKVLGATGVETIASTRTRGSYPVAGGGVQFDFEHTLPSGDKLNTSVQIRPEHLAYVPGGTGFDVPVYEAGTQRPEGEAKHFGARRLVHGSLVRTEKLLRSFGVNEKPKFNPKEGFGLFQSRREKQTTTTAAEGQGERSVAPTSDQTGGMTRQTALGMPLYEHFATEPSWSSRIRGNRPAGPYPLSDSTFDRAGGAAYYRQGRYIPEGRPDVQRGIEAVHDWLNENPSLAGEAMKTVRNAYESHGKAFFTERQEFVPPGTRDWQQNVMGKYGMERQRVAALRNMRADTPARRLFSDDQGNPVTEQSVARERPTFSQLFPGSETAPEKIHTVPEGTARGGYRAEELEHKRQTGGFDKGLFGVQPRSTPAGRTKSSRARLDYAQAIAKSKIKRD